MGKWLSRFQKKNWGEKWNISNSKNTVINSCTFETLWGDNRHTFWTLLQHIYSCKNFYYIKIKTQIASNSQTCLTCFSWIQTTKNNKASLDIEVLKVIYSISELKSTFFNCDRSLESKAHGLWSVTHKFTLETKRDSWKSSHRYLDWDYYDESTIEYFTR